jgi:regulator of sirC expression with transglutaminase-like and TPR domain
MVQYLSYLAFHFRQIENLEGLHETLSFILKIEPENTRYLAERAMLRKKIGLPKEALSDFKRYFAFTDRQSAPHEVNLAYDEIRT